MPSFLESCETLYGTKNLYELLQINKNATAEEVKKAYKKLSLSVHPDRVSDKEKESATEKFKVLSKVYAILSDSEKRESYDDTGCVDDEDCDLQDRDWSEYWRLIFKEITLEDIAAYENTYKNSEEELQDLIKAYNHGKGSMDYLFDYVPFSNPSEEDRLRHILQELIDQGQLQSFRAFTHESTEKREARKKKWEKEAKAAEKAKKELSIKKSKSKKGAENDSLEADDVFHAIMKRKKEREANADALFKHLEDKYCQPKRQGKKAKK